MDIQQAKVFGYLIESDIQVNISYNSLINIKSLISEKKPNRLILRKTMMRLFIYLLKNANNAVIENEEILTNVWDKHGLSSSSQRLWQVMKDLKNKLIVIGISEDFIKRVEKGNTMGFRINPHSVTPIYYFDAQNL
ncbi:hypothetical protein [Pantoea sp. CCBC3-3-1]|uniref:winged helix-turn-helix domain-containing protein n=1 Tax=Pantoea sp. CCBC3-3-1 TaxID=2490851 RepID=UPI0011BF876B|nr:hypothetical protein [Pantoea sp. CCBC3-3-1]